MKKIIFSLFIALGSVSAAQAADANAGKEKSGACSACHGASGVSGSPMFPNLAGQNDAYVIKQLKDFKSGARTDAMMAPMAANLSDEDMADIAAHFASLPSASEQAAASASAGGSSDSAPASAPAAVMLKLFLLHQQLHFMQVMLLRAKTKLQHVLHVTAQTVTA